MAKETKLDYAELFNKLYYLINYLAYLPNIPPTNNKITFSQKQVKPRIGNFL